MPESAWRNAQLLLPRSSVIPAVIEFWDLTASLLKFAQGSSTVAMITAAGMMAAMVDQQTLGFHPVYLATAVGSGSLVGSWMNDSGFWIFAKMSGLTEVETLKTWTVTVSLLAVIGLFVTVAFATVLPLA